MKTFQNQKEHDKYYNYLLVDSYTILRCFHTRKAAEKAEEYKFNSVFVMTRKQFNNFKNNIK